MLAVAAMRKLALFSPLLAIVACSGSSAPITEDAAPPVAAVPAARHDTSPPLRDMVATSAPLHAHDRDEGDDRIGPTDLIRARAVDPIAQRTIAATVAPTTDVDVEGLGAAYPVGYMYPPDTVAAAGTTQVVEVVNNSLAVWSKTGTLVYGPKPTNTLWSGFGGSCETSNDGDAKVKWDVQAGRWVISQFSYFTAPYGVCVAVSATADATGSWHRYFFQFNSPTDQPTIGVWPDAYYLQINGVLGADNLDVPICALDRSAMLAGAQATRQCFSTAARGGLPAPADFTGGTPPPAGEPELLVAPDLSSGNALNTWKLHVDWTTPASSALTGPVSIPVAAYAPGVSVPQPGTTIVLSPGGNFYPMAYRNLGDHEAYVMAEVVASNGLDAVRWYELRGGASAPSLYQQGTFAPADGLHRFMPSGSIDKYGNIAIGYSVGSATVSPGIRFTGRVATDALGTMTQGEGTIVNGAGQQTGTDRWGDYSAMTIDPADDCTFWYAQEYIGENTSIGWRTRLASFRLPGCAGSPPPPPPSGIVNGDFETGSLAPWTSTGSASITSSAHGGSHAAMIGSTGPTTDSSLAQTFTAPSTGGVLSFWYRVTCPDTITYDWATATLTDTTASTTTTILAKTCTNTGAWVQASASLVAGHAYTLTIANHDDNYAGDATYTIVDDVTIGAAPPPPPSGISNGGFETGAFTPWTTTGTTSIGTTAHSGSYAAVAGKVGATTKGDSTVAQTFAAPSTGGTLSFSYKVVCLDSLTYDWATATLKDVTAGTTKTILAKTCSNTGAWAQASATLTASHTYTLTLVSHDDGYSNADATYTLFDDAAIK